MTYTPEPYTLDYYREMNREEAPQAKALSEAITELYHPQSVIDLGCATGLYLEPFVCPVLGIDISLAAFEDEVRRIPRESLITFDLSRDSGDFLHRASVVLCLEVVEHIGCEHSDALVENICQASSAQMAQNTFMGSRDHRENMLKPYWNEVGIGVTKKPGSSLYYVVEILVQR